ncbi:MAG TPA: protein-glutamate O-methyltransferase [Polyangia bacterium]|jgi:chemotaxis protein methyltransferase CheR
MISDREFALFAALIHREAGIFLSEAKRTLLVGRLSRRLRDLGLTSFREYYERVQDDADERMRMLDRISTHETHFFREPRHFEFLAGELFPRWRRRAPAGRRVRVWSAASSTGEEPYSLAMTLLDALPAADGWTHEILATDLSRAVVEQARLGVWPSEKCAAIPRRLLERYMLCGVGAQVGKVKAGPELGEIIRFATLNLNDAIYPVGGPYDLIFCRNVLIYFDAELRARVVRQLAGHLAADGHLFVGHAESLHGLTDLGCVSPTIYAPRGRRS